MKVSKLPSSYNDFIAEFEIPAHSEHLIIINPGSGKREEIKNSKEFYEALIKNPAKREFNLLGYTGYDRLGETDIDIEARFEQFTHLFNETIAKTNEIINQITNENAKAHLIDFRSRIEGISASISKNPSIIDSLALPQMVDLRGKLRSALRELESPDNEANLKKSAGRLNRAQAREFVKNKINSDEYISSLVSATNQAVEQFEKLSISADKTPRALPAFSKKPLRSGKPKKVSLGTENERVKYDLDEEPKDIKGKHKGREVGGYATLSAEIEKLKLLKRFASLYDGVEIKKEMDSYLICTKKENNEKLENIADDLNNVFQIGQIITRSGKVRNKKVISPEYGEIALSLTPFDLEKLTEQGVRQLEKGKSKVASKAAELYSPMASTTDHLKSTTRGSESYSTLPDLFPEPDSREEMLEKLVSSYPDLKFFRGVRFYNVHSASKNKEALEKFAADLEKFFGIKNSEGKRKPIQDGEELGPVVVLRAENLDKITDLGIRELEKAKRPAPKLAPSIPAALKRLRSYYPEIFSIMPKPTLDGFAVGFTKEMKNAAYQMSIDLYQDFGITEKNGQSKGLFDLGSYFVVYIENYDLNKLNEKGFRKLEIDRASRPEIWKEVDDLPHISVIPKALERLLGYYRDAKAAPDGSSGQFVVEMPRDKKPELVKMAEEIMRCFGIKNYYGQAKDVREFQNGFLIVLKPQNIILLNEEGFKRLDQERGKGATRVHISVSSWVETVDAGKNPKSGREK